MGNNIFSKKIFLLITLIFFINPLIFSNEKKEEKQEAVETEAEVESEEEQLRATYVVDIDTANYSHLVAWCKALGLDYSGDLTSLRTRLKKHYNVTGTVVSDSEADALEIKQSDAINYYSIKDIDEDYIELVGNVQVVMTEDSTTHTISADVLIFNKNQKLLTAIGNVTYSKKLASGSEDVFASQVMNFDIENWTGTILKGVSRQEKQLDDDEGEQYNEVFYYSGDRIIKGEGENLILENGLITSSNPENPYYSIKADKIWVLGPGEWAIKNAFLSIGEVPLIPIPFFLKWGDHLFFNPVFGKDDEKGYFVQTTTYLLGEKEEDPDNTFSFLDPSSGESDKKKVLDGFFLRPSDEEESDKKGNSLKDQLEQNKAHIKFMFDVYASKGFMLGFAGDLGSLSIDLTKKNKDGSSKSSSNKKLTISQMNFTAALAASMYDGGFHYYNDPLLFGEDIKYSPIWNKSFFLNPIAALIPKDEESTDSEVLKNLKNTNVELPFLYYFTVNTKLQYNKFSTEINIDYIADTSIYTDFFERRKESLDLKQLLGLGTDSETSDLRLKSTTEWYIKNSLTSNLITNEFFAYPYFSTFNLNGFSLIMNFDRTKVYNKYFLTYPDPDSESDGRVSQNINYLVPKYFSIPIEFNFGGSIFDIEYGVKGFTNNLKNLQKKKPVVKEASAEDKKNYKYSEDNFMRLPWESEILDEEKDKIEDENYIKIAGLTQDDITKKSMINKYFTQKLTWSVDNILLKLQGNYNTERWNSPQDINFALKDFQTIFSGKFALKYTGDIGEGFFSYSNTFTVDGSYHHRIDLRDYESHASDEELSESELVEQQKALDHEKTEFFKDQLTDKKNTKLDLINNFSFTMKPFKFLPYVTDTTITYSIAATLLKLYFDEVENKFVIDTPIDAENSNYNYNRGLFSNHSLDFKLPFTIKDLPQYYYKTNSLTLTLGLESNLLFQSLKGQFSPSFSYNFGPVNQNYIFTFKKDLLSAATPSIDIIDEYELDRQQTWYLNDLRINSNLELLNNNFLSLFVEDLDSKLFRETIKISNQLDYNFTTGKFSNINTNIDLNLIDLKSFLPIEKSEYLLKLKQSVGFSNTDLIELYPNTARFELDLWKLSLVFNAKRDFSYDFDESIFSFRPDSDSQKQLRSESLSIKFNYDYVSPAFWKDRIRLGFGVDTSYTNNFLNIFNSTLSFKFKFKFSLFQYLDLFIESESLNNVPFLYFESSVKKLSEHSSDIVHRGFFEDLFLSLSIDENDRKRAYFKLKNLKLGFVHRFDDWDLNFVYVAGPYSESGASEVLWNRSFAFYITWKGIKPIKSKISYQTTGADDKRIFIE